MCKSVCLRSVTIFKRKMSRSASSSRASRESHPGATGTMCRPPTLTKLCGDRAPASSSRSSSAVKVAVAPPRALTAEASSSLSQRTKFSGLRPPASSHVRPTSASRPVGRASTTGSTRSLGNTTLVGCAGGGIPALLSASQRVPLGARPRTPGGALRIDCFRPTGPQQLHTEMAERASARSESPSRSAPPWSARIYCRSRPR